jgi:hypothetical protein
MSLSNATWQAFSRGANVQETWGLWLFDDLGNELHLSDRDGAIGADTIHGFIQDWGDVRRSIDLTRFVAKVDNCNIKLHNGLYHGEKLIETIGPHAVRKWINREARIYSWLNGNASSKMQIYTGRLRNVSWTADEITLDIEQAQPWDFIRIPDTKDSRTQTLIPVVYGAFSANASNYATSTYCTGKALWPVKVVSRSSTLLGGHAIHDPGTARLHVYESTADLFVPVVDSTDAYWDSAVLEPGESYYTLTAHGLLRHAFKAKAEYDNSDTWDDFTDPENAFDSPTVDDDSNTFATCQKDVEFVEEERYTARFYLPFIIPTTVTDKPDGLAVWVRYRITQNAGPTPEPYSLTSISLFAGGTGHDTDPITIDGAWHTATLTLTDNPVPSGLYVRITATTDTDAGNFTVDIADVRLDVETRIYTGGDAQAQLTAQQDIEYLYCSGNGLSRSWTTGAVQYIHEMHRDLLYRYTGLTSTPAGWSELDEARGDDGYGDGWKVRWWLHEQEDLQNVLEQAQYEGAFIFIWSMTTAGTGRYLFVKNSYSAGDVAATISETDDTLGLSFKHTPFDELVTKQTINYQRHPADGRHILSQPFTNATARTAWNIQTLENVETVELDMLTSTEYSYAWASIRDNIFGDLKRIVSCDIVNPRHFILEIGDIVQFDEDVRYYMITDERRTQGRLSITAREVYA